LSRNFRGLSLSKCFPEVEEMIDDVGDALFPSPIFRKESDAVGEGNHFLPSVCGEGYFLSGLIMVLAICLNSAPVECGLVGVPFANRKDELADLAFIVVRGVVRSPLLGDNNP